jgi:hypothetical protein
MARPETAPQGVEGYAYDPKVRQEGLNDVDRLRAIADRKLAAYLFDLYAVAVRNSDERARPVAHVASTRVARSLARRAMDGAFGPEACELAQALLVDAAGRQVDDEVALLTFERALRKLRRDR